MIKRLFVTFLFLILFTTVSFSQKNDTLVHINGNIITGEIKKIENGILYFSTNGMGTINVETDKVKSLKSGKEFQILLDNGLLYFGSLDTVNGTEAKTRIISHNRIYIIKTISLVEVFPIKNTFWLRTSGDFSIGGNYTKSTEILQLNFAGNLYYRGKKNYFQISWNNQITTYQDSVLSEKTTNTISYRRYIKKHYSMQAVVGASSNLELNLNNRMYLNLTAGKDIIHTNMSIFYTGLGLSANKEIYTDTTKNSNNLEGIFTVTYNFFKRTDPEINIKSYIDTYPSFTQPGRWRIDASLEVRVELFNNFYVGASFYDNFDNSATLESDQHNDWGINGTITYSFH